MNANLCTDTLVPLVSLLACVAVASTPAWAAGSPTEHGPLAARGLHGRGSWQRAEQSARPSAQQWDIDVNRADDDTLDGRVSVAGSPLLQNGILHGRINGRRVSGSIDDPGGNHVADFSGAVLPNGAMQGTYQDRSGEVGRWSWDGPLPR